MGESQETDLENTFQILLATDIHLGYGETKPIIDNDTFVTFEEILQIAARENVDFILLGGDLFHDSRPTPYCINKCTELIRKYCLGDKPVEIEFLSDPSYNFQTSANPIVNYEDPNMNVSIPIFSIHGNHDDPTGKKQISAMDLMASMGLINYFGRWGSVANVEIVPILLRKGETSLALYGLSHIRDERLARLFLDKKVVMRTPENVSDWFNVLILHQNRANRGVKNFIAESFIPEFVDLVMWGHEHDCKIDPVRIGDGKVRITQPGSSVATSLAEGEALPKHVGLLRVKRGDFVITPIELKTVRPFIYKQIALEPPQGDDLRVKHDQVTEQKVRSVVEGLIREAKELGRKADLIPLIRLSVKYADERQVFNTIRFGQGFTNRVANPEDMIKFVCIQKKAARRHRAGAGLSTGDSDDEDNEAVNRVEDLLPKYFTEKNELKVLSMAGLNEAVKRFIDVNATDDLAYIINHQASETLQKAIELQPDEDELENCLERLRKARQKEDQKYINLLNDPTRQRNTNNVNNDVIEIDENSDDDSSSVTSGPSGTPRPATGPGSRGGRGSRGPRGARGGKGSRGGRATAKN